MTADCYIRIRDDLGLHVVVHDRSVDSTSCLHRKSQAYSLVVKQGYMTSYMDSEKAKSAYILLNEIKN